MELAPVLDVAATTAGPAHPAVVVRLDLEAGARQLIADVLVATGMFAEPVDQEDRTPRRPRPGTAGLRLVRRPVADEEIRAVGDAGVADDGRHACRVRDHSRPRTLPDHPGSAYAGSPATCPLAATSASSRWATTARAPARAGMNRAASAPIPTTTAPTATAGCNPAT